MSKDGQCSNTFGVLSMDFKPIPKGRLSVAIFLTRFQCFRTRLLHIIYTPAAQAMMSAQVALL